MMRVKMRGKEKVGEREPTHDKGGSQKKIARTKEANFNFLACFASP